MADPAEGEGPGEAVTLRLDSESALVLFDFLTLEIDGNEARRLRSLCRSDAELWALDSLYSALANRLATPFTPEAGARAAAAAAHLRESRGPWPTDDATGY